MSSKDIFHCEENDDEVIYYDGLKEAFIGLGHQQFKGPYAVYDREKAIEIIARDFYKEKKKEYEFEKMDAEEKLKVVQEIGDEAYEEAMEYIFTRHLVPYSFLTYLLFVVVSLHS